MQSNPSGSEQRTAHLVDAADRVPPLNGVRIVDLTMFMSGPLATLLAADLGAEVIKVESVQRLDGWRGSGRGGERPWENSGLWNWINRNKADATLNLNDERGTNLLKRLVSVSDVVIENYTPRVMENFGLAYDDLRRCNPDLIMLSMPGFGSSGPWRDYAAFAWTTEQMSTICHLTGYEDSGPLFTGTTCGDPLAGLMGALALIAALNHRRRTGEGQHIDLSQVETSTSFVGEALHQAQLLGRDPGRRGNRNPAMAPHNTYPCLDDRWVAIACRSDTEWAALWRIIQPQHTSPAHETLGERLTHLDQVDKLVGGWTAGRQGAAVMHELQQAGIAAGLVMNGPDLLQDPHLRDRGFFIRQDRAEVGEKHYLGQPFRMAQANLPEHRRAQYLGESNREVLCGLLGVQDAEFAELERDQVIGDRPIYW